MQAERGRIAVWLRVCAWCVHDLDGICLMKIIPSSLSCPPMHPTHLFHLGFISQAELSYSECTSQRLLQLAFFE